MLPKESQPQPGPVLGVPYSRKRYPKKAMSKETTEAQEKEHANRQFEAAKRLLKKQDDEKAALAGSYVTTMQTTKEHVGKHPLEEHKPDELSLTSRDEAERTGVDSIKTVPRNTPGKGHTDDVTVDPKTIAGEGGTASPKTEAQKVQEAAQGKGKKSKK